MGTHSCELLMRSAERELTEIERKKSSSDGILTAGSGKNKNGEAIRQRVQEIASQVAEESKRLAATRAQLQRLRKSESSSKPILAALSGQASKDQPEAKVEKRSGHGGQGRGPSNPVPEEHYPELCRYTSLQKQ